MTDSKPRDDVRCERHPDRPATVYLYPPSRPACDECAGIKQPVPGTKKGKWTL